MKITKATDKYNFSQDGEDYLLYLGEIKKGEDTTTRLVFENVVGLEVSATCGCTVANRKNKEDGTVEYTIQYNDCGGTFSKVLNCKNNGQSFKIRIRGKCN